MVIGVETKLKEKKGGGRREEGLDGEWLRRTYPEETFSAADAIVRRDAAGDHLSMRIITARLYAPAHTTVFTPPRTPNRTGIRVHAGYVYTCAMLIIKADIPHAEE